MGSCLGKQRQRNQQQQQQQPKSNTFQYQSVPQSSNLNHENHITIPISTTTTTTTTTTTNTAETNSNSLQESGKRPHPTPNEPESNKRVRTLIGPFEVNPKLPRGWIYWPNSKQFLHLVTLDLKESPPLNTESDLYRSYLNLPNQNEVSQLFQRLSAYEASEFMLTLSQVVEEDPTHFQKRRQSLNEDEDPIVNAAVEIASVLLKRISSESGLSKRLTLEEKLQKSPNSNDWKNKHNITSKDETLEWITQNVLQMKHFSQRVQNLFKVPELSNELLLLTGVLYELYVACAYCHPPVLMASQNTIGRRVTYFIDSHKVCLETDNSRKRNIVTVIFPGIVEDDESCKLLQPSLVAK